MTFETLLPDMIRGALAMLGTLLTAALLFVLTKVMEEHWPQRHDIARRLKGRLAKAIIPSAVVMAALYASLLWVQPGPVAKGDLLVGLGITALVSIAVTLRAFTFVLDVLRLIAAPRDSSAG